MLKSLNIKKRVLYPLTLSIFVLVASGCIDLTAVPGVVILPTGDHQVIFLEAPPEFINDGPVDGNTNALVTMEITGGNTVAYYDGAFSGGFVTAFDAHPITGAVAYVVTEGEVGAKIQISEGGNVTELATFPIGEAQGVILGTQLAYSPTGNLLAFSLVELPLGITLNQMEDLETMPEVLNQFQFEAYLIEVASGEITPLNDPTLEAVNTFAWSPSGSHLAYNAWVDTNGDGLIYPAPANLQEESRFLDHSQLRIREIASGETTAIDSATIDVIPEFLSDTQLAYVAYGAVFSDEEIFSEIMVYDFATSTATSVRQSDGLLTYGLATSPDGSRVVWIEQTTSASGAEETTRTLYMSDLSFVEPVAIVITELEGVLDMPVWVPDADAVLLTASGFGGTLSNQPTSEGDLIPNSLLRVDLATGEQTVLSNRGIVNPAAFTSIFAILVANPADEEASE